MGVLEFLVPFYLLNTARVFFFFRFENGPSKPIPQFEKGKQIKFSYQFRAISCFYSIQGTERTLFIFIVDRGQRQSRLPSLARVLLCLFRVGVPQVSWAVRYFDKLQWRALLSTSFQESDTLVAHGKLKNSIHHESFKLFRR